jgi:hypothetical protein
MTKGFFNGKRTARKLTTIHSSKNGNLNVKVEVLAPSFFNIKSKN